MWTELMHDPIAAPTQWVRVTITHDYTYDNSFFSIQLDEGAPLTNAYGYSDKAGLTETGEWFLVACTNGPRLTSFSARGCNIDDMVVSEGSGSPAEWTITILAMTNGYIISTNNAAVSEGGTANFRVKASQYYSITNILTNATSEGGAPYGLTHDLVWSNVNGHGTIQAFIEPDVTTNTGTPHWWIAKYYGHQPASGFNYLALSDTDREGAFAWEEEIANTDPTDSNSVFYCSGVHGSTGGVVFEWPSAPERLYCIESTTNLMDGESWGLVATNVTTAPTLVNTYTVQVDNAAGRIFRTTVHK